MAATFYGSTPMQRCGGAVMLGVRQQLSSLHRVLLDHHGMPVAGRVSVMHHLLPPLRCSTLVPPATPLPPRQAVLDGSVCQAADITTAPRPVMHIGGAVDGQARLPRLAWAAAAAAPLATQLGAR